MTYPASARLPNNNDVTKNPACQTNNKGGFSSTCWYAYEKTANSYSYLMYRFMALKDPNRY